MKSPVPFLKPKSYYSSPIKTPVIRDEIVPQIDPVKPVSIEVTPSPIIEQTVIYEEQPIIEHKKSKQKLTKSKP